MNPPMVDPHSGTMRLASVRPTADHGSRWCSSHQAYGIWHPSPRERQRVPLPGAPEPDGGRAGEPTASGGTTAQSASEVGPDLSCLICGQLPACAGDALPALISEPLADRSVADAQLDRKLSRRDRLSHPSNLGRRRRPVKPLIGSGPDRRQLPRQRDAPAARRRPCSCLERTEASTRRPPRLGVDTPARGASSDRTPEDLRPHRHPRGRPRPRDAVLRRAGVREEGGPSWRAVRGPEGIVVSLARPESRLTSEA